MPLNQPTNISPSTFAGVGGGTIDASQPLTVSWQVNGSSAMTAYQIQIFQNTTASTKVYDSGKNSLGTPFFGTTFNGDTQRFSVTIPESGLSGLSNGFRWGYKLQITQWWNSGSIRQLSPSFFITRSVPRLQISAFSNPVAGRTAVFTAIYSQVQGDTLDWFRWMLAEKGQEDSPLEDSGNIYGTEDIRVQYDGLFTETEYVVRCLIQTENGVQADTGWVGFTVQYTVSDMQGYVTACPSPTEGIVLRWPLVSYIPGAATGPYAILNGSLSLPAGSSVTWESRNGADMDFETPWTLAWSGVIPSSGTSPLITLQGGGHTLIFGIRPNQAFLSLDNQTLFSCSLTHISPTGPWRFVLTPREARLYYLRETGGLVPASTLFPGSALYPMATQKIWTRYTAPLTWVQPDVASITLHGEQICHWITLIQGEVSGQRLESLWTDLAYTPSWELDTRLLATFQGTALNGGNITPINDTIAGAALYRRKDDNRRLDLVANLDISTTSLVDEGFRNQSSYTYYLFVLGAKTYVSAPLISNSITPMFWNWTVLDCTTEHGVYHLQAAHIFRNNVSTDSISNNNTPSLLQNFTPYPLRQPTSFNYCSSTLTGYIGRVDQAINRYIDTTEMAEQLRALSVRTTPKFLRDRKGNLWHIETSAAITVQTGDNQIPQPYFGSLPWVEVGPIAGMSIVCTPEDGAWDEVTGEEPVTDAAAKIVVTAPVGSSIVVQDSAGTVLVVGTAAPFVAYTPPGNGTYTVTAALGGARASAQVTVSAPLTYYVGLTLEKFSASLLVDGPAGTSVTVTGTGYTATKIIPATSELKRAASPQNIF